jgi:cellulose synthase operon protein B
MLKSSPRALSRLAAALLAASAAFAAPGAFAGTMSVANAEQAAAAIAAPLDLRRFAAGADALFFQGENGARDIPFYVTSAETAGAAKLVLSVQSAVSDLPEASEMTVLVNNRPVGKSRLGEADRAELAFDLPAGLLQPGFNAVSIVVGQTHRVDCSISATYELWARIDPLKSGVLIANAQRGVHDFADLAGIDRNAAGQFAIRGRIAPDASMDAIEGTLSAIQSFVVAAGVDRPLVDFNEYPGSGPGLDIVVGPMKGSVSAQSGTGLPFLSFDPGAPGGRPTLYVAGDTPDAIRANLAQFAGFAAAAQPAGSAEGLQALATLSGRPLGAGQKVAIASLGFRETNFSGRFYNDGISFSLPPDFYASDYGDAAVILQAAYAPNLLKSAQFVVRANGAIVSTLGLSSFRGGTLSNQRLPIPLSKLRPGRNTVSFEAFLPNAADESCGPGALAQGEPRLFVSGQTALEIPTLARIGHAPDIAATTAGLSQIGATRRVTAFVPTPAGPSLDAAGTFFAAMAASARKIVPVDVTASAPPQTAGETIAFGSLSELPPAMLSYVGLRQPGTLANGVAEAAPASGLADGAAGPSGSPSILLRAGEWLGVSPARAAATETDAPATFAFGQPFDLSDRLVEMRAQAETFGQNAVNWAWQMIKPNEAEERAFYQVSDATGLVIAQRPAPHADKAAWTVVAAQSDGDLLSGVAAVTAPERWVQLGGAISALSRETGAVSTLNARSERIYETQPRSLENGRLVLAGWFSRHVERYVLGIMAAFLLLGFTTHLFLRTVGGRN